MSTPRGRVAAGIAALVTVAAAVGFAAPVAGAAPDQTPAGQCVGLVVDSGQGRPATACVPFRAKMSGQDLLVAAGRKLTFDQHGFICRIDGYPANCASDNTHYWSYYHRAPGAADGKWAYSQAGASAYVVHPGETEGWAYQNGSQRQPAPVPYATLESAGDGAGPSGGAHPANSGAAAPADHGDGGGTPTWTVVAVVAVIVLLAAGAARMALRRRRA